MRRLVMLCLLAATPARADDPAKPETLVQREQRCAAGEWKICDDLRFRIADEPAATRDRYKAACTKSDAASCAFLGDWFFEHSLRAEKTLGDHLAWFGRSCRAGSRYGCDRYAWSLPDSRAKEALAVYTDLCKRDWAPSCLIVGARLDRLGEKTDKRRIVDLYAKACALGALDGCWRAGLELAWWRESDPAERTRSRALMDAACTAGNAASCSILDSIYRCGRGTACDLKLAAAYKKKAETLDPPRPERAGNSMKVGGMGTCSCSTP